MTVAPITSTIRRLSTEVPVGPANGLDQASVVSCDNIVTVLTSTLGRHLGYLLPAQEAELAGAIRATFDPRLSEAHSLRWSSSRVAIARSGLPPSRTKPAGCTAYRSPKALSPLLGYLRGLWWISRLGTGESPRA